MRSKWSNNLEIDIFVKNLYTMDANTDQLLSLLNLILPAEILEYFTIVNIEIRPQEVHLFLDEKNSAPEEFKHEKLISICRA